MVYFVWFLISSAICFVLWKCYLICKGCDEDHEE